MFTCVNKYKNFPKVYILFTENLRFFHNKNKVEKKVHMIQLILLFEIWIKTNLYPFVRKMTRFSSRLNICLWNEKFYDLDVNGKGEGVFFFLLVFFLFFKNVFWKKKLLKLYIKKKKPHFQFPRKYWKEERFEEESEADLAFAFISSPEQHLDLQMEKALLPLEP